MKNGAGGIHRRREQRETLSYLCDRSCLPPRDMATIDATRRVCHKESHVAHLYYIS